MGYIAHLFSKTRDNLPIYIYIYIKTILKTFEHLVEMNDDSFVYNSLHSTDGFIVNRKDCLRYAPTESKVCVRWTMIIIINYFQ